jgi:hypothetical protein
LWPSRGHGPIGFCTNHIGWYRPWRGRPITRQLGFPKGPFNLAFTSFVESFIRIEAGQLDRAAVLAADLSKQAERHGFDL